MLGHLGRQNLQKRVSIANLRALRENLGSALVVLQFSVIDEAEIIVEVPIIGIVLNAVQHQFDGAHRLSGSIGRGGSEETRAKLVSRDHVRIEGCGDLEQWREFVIGTSAQVMTVSEILNRAGPVDAGHQSIEPQAGALQDLWRADVESVFDIGARPNLINTAQ